MSLIEPPYRPEHAGAPAMRRASTGYVGRHCKSSDVLLTLAYGNSGGFLTAFAKTVAGEGPR